MPDMKIAIIRQRYNPYGGAERFVERALGALANEGAEVTPRHIDHVAFRTMNPEAMAHFYRDVFELVPSNAPTREGDPNYYLTDGHMTLVIMPWDITDYDGTGIITRGMDHIGFRVESVEDTKADIARIAADNPRLAPAALSAGAEGLALASLFARSCPIGQYQMADCDGTLIDLHQ